MGGATDRDKARWALRDDRKLSKMAKLVWLILDSRGEDPHPSIGTLAADCGLGTSKSTVRLALAELERSGWLEIRTRTTKDGDSDTNRYVLQTPGQAGGGHARPVQIPGQKGVVRPSTHGVGRQPAYGGTTVDPEDLTEDQQVEDQRNQQNLCRRLPAAGADFEDQERHLGQERLAVVTGWVIAAHIAAQAGLISGPEDHAAVCWLRRALQVQANKKRRDAAQFARYLARCCQAAPDELAELVEAELTGDLNTLIEDGASGELLAAVRAKAAAHSLTAAQSRLCGRIAAAAEAVADPDMTADEATKAGIALHVPAQEGQP